MVQWFFWNFCSKICQLVFFRTVQDVYLSIQIVVIWGHSWDLVLNQSLYFHIFILLNAILFVRYELPGSCCKIFLRTEHAYWNFPSPGLLVWNAEGQGWHHKLLPSLLNLSICLRGLISFLCRYKLVLPTLSSVNDLLVALWTVLKYRRLSKCRRFRSKVFSRYFLKNLFFVVVQDENKSLMLLLCLSPRYSMFIWPSISFLLLSKSTAACLHRFPSVKQ